MSCAPNNIILCALLGTIRCGDWCYDRKCTGYTGKLIDCNQELFSCDKAGPACNFVGNWDQVNRDRKFCREDETCMYKSNSGKAHCYNYKSRRSSQTAVLLICASILVSVLVFCCCCYFFGKGFFKKKCLVRELEASNVTQTSVVPATHQPSPEYPVTESGHLEDVVSEESPPAYESSASKVTSTIAVTRV